MADGSRSSSGWVGWVLPSVADLIFVAILGSLLFTPLSVRLLGDAGIGWHIRTGQLILANHEIPRTDPFSSSMSGQPWFAWEWLYDVIAGGLEAKFGFNGVTWLTAVVIATVFAWLFLLLRKRVENILAALGLFLLALSASMIHFLARPHVFSWLFTLAWFWILERSELCGPDDRRARGRLWLLPILMLMWVNVHGGFLVGFALLVIFWLGSGWAWVRTNDDRIEEALAKIAAGQRLRDLTAVGLLTAGASLVNPYGWKLHAHIYSYLSNRFLIDHIEEFQSPNFHKVAQKCFAVLLLMAIAALAVRGRKFRMSEVLTVLFAVYAGLYASRNIPVSSLLLVMVVAPRICEGISAAFLRRMHQVDSGVRGHAWPLLAALTTLLIAANGGGVGPQPLMDAHFDRGRMPVGAVTYIGQQHWSGAVLSPDFWGGYVIYRLYPKQRVVVDDRHDFYGEAFLKSYLKMVHVERGWREFLDQHEASCLVLPRDSGLANVLIEVHAWIPVYADDVAVVFRPANAFGQSRQ